MKKDEALKIVEAGYDRLTGLYAKERTRFANRKEIEAFSSLLPEKAKVLDAGCGTGIPIARFLVDAGFDVTGVDLSKAMVETAQKNVPEASFRQMNMVSADFPPESFDGLISCYAIIHTPREMHDEMFKSFSKVLKPGGVMLVSVAAWAWEEVADYLGVDMYWSHFEPEKTEALIRDAGFDIEFGRTVEDGGETHHWVLARKCAGV